MVGTKKAQFLNITDTVFVEKVQYVVFGVIISLFYKFGALDSSL